MSDSSSPRPRLLLCLLDECYYCVTPHRPVVCRLWRMRPAKPPATGGETSAAPTYAIGMESASERYLYCVGTDEAEVRALYRRVVEGELDPVHLGEVVEDFLWAKTHLPPAACEGE